MREEEGKTERWTGGRKGCRGRDGGRRGRGLFGKEAGKKEGNREEREIRR